MSVCDKMLALTFALCGFATPVAAIDHRQIDIPVAYRGTWALDPKLCGKAEPGPALVQIGARRVSFFEEHAYLSLAHLNEVDEPPEFFGKFSIVRGLSFAEEVIRLDMRAGRLLITRNAIDSDDEPNPIGWARCSANEGT